MSAGPKVLEDNPFVHGRKVVDALIAAGIADHNTQRVIIDVPINGLPIVHVQKAGDVALLDVVAVIASGDGHRVG